MTRKLYTLSVILVVLLLLTIWKNTVTRHTVADIAEQSRLEEPLGDEFLASRVVRLEMFPGVRPGRKIICNLEGGEWQLASHGNAPAEPKKVERLLATLKHLQGQLRMTGSENLRDFYLAEEPEASRLRPEDFVERYVPAFLDRLKTGGERLGSVFCQLQEGPIPGVVRDFLIAKGYEIPETVVSAAGEGRWHIAGQYYLFSHKAGVDIYLCDPLAEYLKQKLTASTLELLQNYDPKTFPAGLTRFVLERVNGRDAVARQMREELNRLSLLAKDDVIEHLRRYTADSTESSHRAAAMILTQLIKRALSADLNRVLERELIYDPHRFAEPPGKEILEMIAEHSEEGYVGCVNRLLLESAYPREIAVSRRPIHVKVYSEKDRERPSYYLLVGKKATGDTGEAKATCFVRAQGAAKVYEVGEDLRAALTIYRDEEPLQGLPVFPWLSRIIEVDREQISRIAITYPDQKFVFTKKADGSWQVQPDCQLKPNAMDFLTGQLASLEAMDVVAPKVADTLRLKWDFALEVSAGGQIYTVAGSLPVPGENGYCLRPDRPGVVYRVWSGKFSGIFPKNSDLFE